ncbi:preprotein translocase subunit SecE [Natronospira proteinivora]|uniref:Protein translocase subunit SecE n=1 Tax=Natronospira proteinivora TaxID=1807133 RepID=A0ABT1GCQ1_9GAMM|nr:preprotein translocase subunit SecE [Natronospira proteinivora]MCP1728665.1 preprotein translocase subunit SecE [Natronospira proteinivora]
MSGKPEVQTSGVDTLKLLLGASIALSGIFAFYYFGDQPAVVRWLGLLALMIIGALVAVQSTQGRQLWGFGRTSWFEVRKVVWPNRQETTQTTIAVLVMVTLLAIFLWLIDMLLAWGAGHITSPGG